MDDTWFGRDLPALRAVVEYFEAHNVPSDLPHRIAAAGEIDLAEFGAALFALVHEQPPYFSMFNADADGVQLIGAPTGHARRAVGAWPTAAALAEQIVDALAEIDEPENSERGSKLTKLRDGIGGVGRDLFVDVVSSVITRSAGLG
ncbi:hypothetical protein [Rhodococcus sp. NPDC057529]|uniref:hypothetical protein n=1 Tax=Rhodococcus sp. NPDC057529 TaxID=3346158 RepID=UPI00366D57A7